jgi:hypothetical protein
LLAAAELREDLRETSNFQWLPPCDRRKAWDGFFPEHRDRAIHVEAAAFQGKPVFFRIGGTWTVPREPAAENPTVSGVLLVVVTLSVALLGMRQLRQGRGDRHGAVVMGGAFVVAYVAAWLLGGHHPGTIGGEILGLISAIGIGGFAGSVMALAYLALEPAMRRRWPWRLTASTRVTGGRLRDPLVGRDLLVGILGGIGCVLILQAFITLPQLLNAPKPTPLTGITDYPGMLAPPAPRLYILANSIFGAFWAVILFASAFLLALVLRREWLAWAGYIAIFTITNTLLFAPSSLPVAMSFIVTQVLLNALGVFLIARFGLWAFTAALSTMFLLVSLPLTWDPSAWYFSQGLLGAGVLMALAVYGFMTACGGRRLLQGFLGDE